jgi:hypothetical protein
MTKLREYPADDVRLIAQTLLEYQVTTQPSGPYGSEEDRCRYCYAPLSDPPIDSEHDLDCPILVAQDLLT